MTDLAKPMTFIELLLALKEETTRESAVKAFSVLPHISFDDLVFLLNMVDWDTSESVHVAYLERLLPRALGQPIESIDLTQEDETIRRFVTTGEARDEMNALSQRVVTECSPIWFMELSDRMWSNDLMSVATFTSNSSERFDDLFLFFTLASLVRARATDFALQVGKHRVHAMHSTYLSPNLKEDNDYYDFETGTWVRLNYPAHDASLATRQRYQRIKEDEPARRNVKSVHLRIWNNRFEKFRVERVLSKQFASTKISWFVREVKQASEVVRLLSQRDVRLSMLVKAQTEKQLVCLVDLLETAMRVVKVSAFQPWEVTALIDEIKSLVKMLSDSAKLKDMNDVESTTIIIRTMDVLRDFEGFLNGELREMRRDALLQSITSSVHSIDLSLREGVRWLSRVSAQLSDVNHQLGTANHRLHTIDGSLKDARDIGHATLIGVGALGMTLSSMRMNVHASSSSFGVFGGTSSHFSASMAPHVSFSQAYRHLSQGGRVIDLLPST